MPVATLLPALGAGVVATPLTLAVTTRADYTTTLTSLANSFARRFQTELNDCGSGQFTLGAEDADLATIDLDQIVTFSVHGNDAFTMLVEQMHRVTLTEGEAHDQVVAVSGRGHLAMLEEGVVYPARGVDQSPVEEDRVFNWTAPSPDFDDSSWGFANYLGTIAQAQTDWAIQPFAEGIHDTTGGVIWASSGTMDDAPDGFCYFRKDQYFGDGWYLIEASADNAGQLYLDGAKIIKIESFTGIYTYLAFFSAGTRTLAAEVQNYYDPPAGGNPGALVVNVYNSNPAGAVLSLYATTDASWKIMPYPAYPPGMTPGRVMKIAVEEAQARGALPSVLLGFNEAVDSAGVPWPVVTDIATKVGTSYLTFFKELTTTYVDMFMVPRSFVLLAWNKGGRANHPAIDLHVPTSATDPTTGNLFEQTHSVAV